MLPSSCCSWIRAANCCRSATSLPWACLMKGCSRRWVTDGRASKSLIRHLTNTKTSQSYLISLQVTSKENRGKTLDRHKPPLPHYHLPIFKSANEKLCNHLNILETWFVGISSNSLSHQWRAPLKSGSLICVWVPHGHYHHGPESKQALLWHGSKSICDVQCLPIGDVTLWYRLAAALQHQFAADTNAHNILLPDRTHPSAKPHMENTFFTFHTFLTVFIYWETKKTTTKSNKNSWNPHVNSRMHSSIIDVCTVHSIVQLKT